MATLLRGPQVYIIWFNKNQFRIHLQSYHQRKAELYKKCFAILGVSEGTNQDNVREAYINLVKKVHPDSGHKEASAERFSEIDNAFRTLQAKYAKERRGIPDEPTIINPDIKHTAPQHRQYLSYDGTGYGSPSQREKQYQNVKATKAFQKIVDYRIETAKASEGSLLDKQAYYRNHAIKTKYGFDRVVEDLIQEAMSKGDFDNLSGIGKPLSNIQSQNPYVDFVQHKINKILIDNGFSPEWITLQKDIRIDTEKLRDNLKSQRRTFGPYPLSENEKFKWSQVLDTLRDDEKNINGKIDKYNYLVPILTKQMLRINLNRIADEILEKCPGHLNGMANENDANFSVHQKKGNKGLIDTILSFF